MKSVKVHISGMEKNANLVKLLDAINVIFDKKEILNSQNVLNVKMSLVLFRITMMMIMKNIFEMSVNGHKLFLSVYRLV